MGFGEVSAPSHDGRSYNNGKAYSMMLHAPYLLKQTLTDRSH